MVTAITELEYSPYCVKHKTLNQSINMYSIVFSTFYFLLTSAHIYLLKFVDIVIDVEFTTDLIIK